MSDAENTDAPPSLPDEMFLVDVPGEDGAPDRATLSFSRSPTVLLTFAANRYTRALSRSHQKAHGIGAIAKRMSDSWKSPDQSRLNPATSGPRLDDATLTVIRTPRILPRLARPKYRAQTGCDAPK